ncbi:ATP-binding protein [Streptomyces sp. NPDC046985]|uniref:ATP-binding protein n=1 Tax=Streptomyces sp. NPDC046985 TaxID=3155377 RepID=UPI0033D4E89A
MRDASLRAVGWARSLPMDTEVRAAREWTRDHLESLGWTEADPETVDSVLLTVSELVTNAHKHAHSSAQMVLAWDNRCLHLAVHDASSEMPHPREPSPDSLGGRGMLLVDALADWWETRPCPHGKTIVACFRPRGVPGAAEPADDSGASGAVRSVGSSA